MAIPVSELQSISPSAIIELFTIELDVLRHGVSEVYRFHAGVNEKNNGNLIWAGNTYIRMPIEAEGFEYTGNGQLPRPKIRISNIFGYITTLLSSLPNGLEGARVTRIRTLARYLDAVNFSGDVNPFGTPDSTAEFPQEIYYVDRKTAENRDFIEYELAAIFDLQGIKGPKRQCIANICQWKYRGSECGYTGTVYFKSDDTLTANASEDVCGKRLSSCEARFAPITRTGSVVNGSTTLTLNSTSGLQAGVNGYPISGFGIQPGTIISSITNATTLVMSAPATGNSSVTVNGTPSTSAATMTVTSAAGLAVGQTVTGANIGGETIISSISGTTLTLSQRPYSIYRSGTYQAAGVDRINIDTTGLSVGLKVFGSNNINTTITNVTGTYITLASYGNLVNSAPVSLYFIPASVSQSSYSFTGSANYTFRPASSSLPFGSFPGVGAYY